MVLEVKGNDDDVDIPELRETTMITVTGYDIELPHDDAVRMLRKRFSSCGEITDVYVDQPDDKLADYAFIYFMGKDAEKKALKLNGKDMGGWKAQVEDDPTKDYARSHAAISVRGFDTSLNVDDIKLALTKHFSSCGRVWEVVIAPSTLAVVCISGENAAVKALKLGVTSIQGQKVVAKLISKPIYPTVHSRHKFRGSCRRHT